VSQRAPIEYAGVRSARGPLLVIEQVDGIGWDEVAEIHLDSGEVRNGVVLDIAEGLAVVEVFQGTGGISLDAVRVSFSGAPMSIPVGEAWLGRVWNGRGQPLDGGPAAMGDDRRPIQGWPINPAARLAPSDPILTGVSVIDGLATLVRGQKLPVFSVGGLPHLELAAQIAVQSTAGGERFSVVFAAMGITEADASRVRSLLEARLSGGELALFLNTAHDPYVERVVTPRIALTVAEHLAFELGHHVLVVMSDMTSYCDALREVSSARGEVPARRAYPGYLYSDLASLYERAGRIRGRPGSLTQVPVLTMPAGDITHPVPDLTGYITEGQLVLAAELDHRGIYPPVDVLGSLSRLMRLGAGPGRTRDDHLAIAAQLVAAVAQARHAADLAEVVGEDALSGRERGYIAFEAAFEARFLSQHPAERRSIDDTLDRGWSVAALLPRTELSMIDQATLDAHLPEAADAAADPAR
jgi:V/A-type H+/Na+-transporting ATPase subunit B